MMVGHGLLLQPKFFGVSPCPSVCQETYIPFNKGLTIVVEATSQKHPSWMSQQDQDMASQLLIGYGIPS